MKYHVVLNGCFQDVRKQADELSGFIRQVEPESEQGNTFIICDGKQDGDDKRKLAEMAPTTSVIFIILDHYNPEAVLHHLEKNGDIEGLYLFGSNYAGGELAVRFGKRMDGSSLTGCSGLEEYDDFVHVEKMVYSNHLKGTFRMQQKPFCIAIARGGEECAIRSAEISIIGEIDAREAIDTEIFEQWKITEETTEKGLDTASFIVIAGRGAKNRETAAQLEQSAEKMGAAFGASRPAVMNAWMPMKQLVGVSGAMTKPEVCITAGVSGAPALYAGIEKSKFIVAVNTDERAPIIKKADAAIVGDCVEVLEELSALVERGSYYGETAYPSDGGKIS